MSTGVVFFCKLAKKPPKRTKWVFPTANLWELGTKQNLKRKRKRLIQQEDQRFPEHKLPPSEGLKEKKDTGKLTVAEFGSRALPKAAEYTRPSPAPLPQPLTLLKETVSARESSGLLRWFTAPVSQREQRAPLQLHKY